VVNIEHMSDRKTVNLYKSIQREESDYWWKRISILNVTDYDNAL
jgi:hypothetical protein